MTAMRERISTVLTSWPFLCALAVLLVNDWWLKAAHPGVVSGKLSDFAGLAVVGMLLAAIWPERRRSMYLAIGLLFLWWKSPWSGWLIDLINLYAPVPMGRTVDYSDLVALAVLPACRHVAANAEKFRLPWLPLRRALFLPVIVLTVLGTAATSRMPLRDDDAQSRLDEEIDEAVAQVAARHGLVCDACPLSDGSMVYMGGGLLMAYRLAAASTVTFTIRTTAGSATLAASCEKADALRAALKILFAEKFRSVVYAERSEPRCDQRAEDAS